MRRGAMRLIVAALMTGVLTLWAVPLKAQESAVPLPEELITGPAMFCTPVLQGILVGGVVTNDVVIFSNPSTTTANVTTTWFSSDGTTNTSNFTMLPRTFFQQTPAVVGFGANGGFSVIVRAAGNLFIAASTLRIQGGQLTGQSTCFFLT
jgi:hypothetical protein